MRHTLRCTVKRIVSWASGRKRSRIGCMACTEAVQGTRTHREGQFSLDSDTGWAGEPPRLYFRGRRIP